FVPAACDADEGLMDLLLGETHGIIKGAVWSAVDAFGGVTARQSRPQTGLGVHNFDLSPSPNCNCDPPDFRSRLDRFGFRKNRKPRNGLPTPPRGRCARKGMAKSRRGEEGWLGMT